MKPETLDAFEDFLGHLSIWSAQVDQGKVGQFSSDDLAEAMAALRAALKKEVE